MLTTAGAPFDTRVTKTRIAFGAMVFPFGTILTKPALWANHEVAMTAFLAMVRVFARLQTFVANLVLHAAVATVFRLVS